MPAGAGGEQADGVVGRRLEGPGRPGRLGAVVGGAAQLTDFEVLAIDNPFWRFYRLRG